VNGGRKGGKEMKRWERFDGVSVTEKERGRVAWGLLEFVGSDDLQM
jgi:hypothetical protein